MHPDLFIGRQQQREEVAKLLEASRVVTVVGAPGVGKSRLSQVVVDQVGSTWDETFTVDLAGIDDSDLVAPAVASALGMTSVAGAATAEWLAGALGSRRLLIVLDNCDRVAAAATRVIAAVTAACPHVAFLVTSRSLLGLADETSCLLRPLSFPDEGEEVTVRHAQGYGAVALFVDRASRVVPTFVLNDANVESVVDVCRGLDGIPLAIELAAARTTVLAPAEMAELLSQVGVAAPNAAEDGGRHSTVESAVTWTLDLLDPPDQVMLRRLAVFVDGFTPEAAEEVCAGRDLGPDQVRTCLTALEAASLLVGSGADGLNDAEVVASATPGAPGAATPGASATTAPGSSRYRLLEPVRAVAAARLAAAGETDEASGRHARWAAALAAQAEPFLTSGAMQQPWLARLDAEAANLRAALAWSLAHDGPTAVELASSLTLWWRMRGAFGQGLSWFESTLPLAWNLSPKVQAKALWGAGLMAARSGHHDEARRLLSHGIELARPEADAKTLARAFLVLGTCEPRVPAAAEAYDQSITWARGANDTWSLANALALRALMRHPDEPIEHARAMLAESVEVARGAADGQSLAFVLVGWGGMELAMGRPGQAQALFEEGRDVAIAGGHQYEAVTALLGLGQTALARGKLEAVDPLVHAALKRGRRAGLSTSLDLLVLQARARQARGELAGAKAIVDGLALFEATGGKRSSGLLRVEAQLSDALDHPAVAMALASQALSVARHPIQRTQALLMLAHLARTRGETREASDLASRALGLVEQMPLPLLLADTLDTLGGVAVAGGTFDRAARILGASAGIRAAHGLVRFEPDTPDLDSDLAALRDGLTAAELDAAWTAGEAMTRMEAIALGRGDEAAPDGGWDRLTEGEWDVVRLLVKGLTNPEIAAALSVARGTVRNRFTKVFAKTGITSRLVLAREAAGRLPRGDT